jgi:hypothetical protein
MPSQAQREFTAKLDALLQEGLSLFGMEDGSHLGDWVCVISAPYLNPDGELTSGYAITFSGNLLEHNAMGLLRKGSELLDRGEEQDGG